MIVQHEESSVYDSNDYVSVEYSAKHNLQDSLYQSVECNASSKVSLLTNSYYPACMFHEFKRSHHAYR
jgi:hypothetical protein